MVFLRDTWLRNITLIKALYDVIIMFLFDLIAIPLFFLLCDWEEIADILEDHGQRIQKHKAVLLYMFRADVIDRQEADAIAKSFAPEYPDDE